MEEPTKFSWSGECLLYLEAVRITKSAGRETVRVKFELPQVLIRAEEKSTLETKKCVFSPTAPAAEEEDSK